MERKPATFASQNSWLLALIRPWLVSPISDEIALFARLWTSEGRRLLVGESERIDLLKRFSSGKTLIYEQAANHHSGPLSAIQVAQIHRLSSQNLLPDQL